MQFRSSVLAGVVLNREAIQSENYVPGADGWVIRKDGSCEFGSGTFRGSLVAGSISGASIGGCTLTDCDSLGGESVNPRIILDETGSGEANAGIFGYGTTTGTQTFNADGTWTVPAGVTSVKVELWGGGGGGRAGGGSGGAGGEYAAEYALAVTPAETLTIDVGAGGAGGTYGVDGTAGASSRVLRGATVLVEAHGGEHGDTVSIPATSGSTASVHYDGGGANKGTIHVAIGGGGGGGAGGTAGAGGTGAATNSYTGGAGGAGGTTGGGAGGAGGTSDLYVVNPGAAGTAPGGGGGAGAYSPIGIGAGGAGAAGRVVLTWVSAAILQGSIARVPGTDPVTGTAYPYGIRAYLNLGTAHTLRMDNPTNATGTSTAHPIQVGETTTPNLRIDRAGFEAMNNGSPATLYLNRDTDGPITTGDGDITLDGEVVQYDHDTFTTFTPTVTNAGTATWSTRTGWYVRIGKMYFLNIYLVASAAGSGTSYVSLTAPVDIDRSTRQVIPMNVTSLSNAGTGSFPANGHALTFTGSTGTIIDRLNCGVSDPENEDDQIQGQDILNGTIITIQGWFRAA